MLMKMLEAGGMTILADGLRTPDDDNPQGYYEYEPVKRIQTDASWLDFAEGKAVKILSHLLSYLPDTKTYNVIFMKRDLAEVVASQNAMLARMGKPKSPVSDVKLMELFEKQLVEVTAWLEQQKHIDVLYLNYQDIIQHPFDNVRKIQHFLKDIHRLDIEKMVKTVDRSLYRQKK
jgi:DNA-binding TFAR19-related protein (PDSD5 family)